MTPPEKPERPSRRNRTRQRERLLELLLSADSHPTAAELFDALLPQFPQLSIGTVYRNLEVLVSEGLIEEVESAGPAVRYDGNTHPHHHFVCDGCGSIRDVELTEPRGLRKRLEDTHGLRAERIRIGFHGLCEECSDRDTQSIRTQLEGT